MECVLCKGMKDPSKKGMAFYEDSFCAIFNGGSKHMKVGKKVIFAKEKFTLTTKEHVKELDNTKKERCKQILEKFLLDKFGLKKGEDYFMKITMGSCPEHFHLHAFVLPFSDVEKVTLDYRNP